MLFAFKKNDQEDLTPDQINALKELMKEWLS